MGFWERLISFYYKKIRGIDLENYPSIEDHPLYAGEETDENKGFSSISEKKDNFGQEIDIRVNKK